MSEIRDSVVKIVEDKVKHILHTFHGMQNGNCVSFNEKTILDNYNDIRLLINLFSIRLSEIGITKKEFADVESFIFYFS